MGTKRKKGGNGHVAPEDEPKLPVPINKGEPQGNGGPHRRATVKRRTSETDVSVALDVDGTGRAEIDTNVPFLNHMLEALARHSLIDLKVVARGDVEIDPHHTVEDVGLCIGRALVDAIGDRTGMERYGSYDIPFDDTLVRCHLDLCGRAAFVYRVEITPGRIGSFDVELSEVFFQALANEGRMNLHLIKEYGENRHHIVEACFKSLARALEHAVKINPRRAGQVASTKGRLD